MIKSTADLRSFRILEDSKDHSDHLNRPFISTSKPTGEKKPILIPDEWFLLKNIFRRDQRSMIVFFRIFWIKSLQCNKLNFRINKTNLNYLN